MNGRVSIAAVLLLSAGSIGLLWWTGLPLGVPGEWTWQRIRYPADEAGLAALVGPAVALLGAAAYVALCWSLGRRIGRSRRLETGCWLSLLVAAGFGLLLLIESAPPAGHDLSRLPLVLYDRGASGYFTTARYGSGGEPLDVREFLAGYEDHIREGDIDQRVLHIGTHPPGLILCHRGLIALSRRGAGLTQFVRELTPASADKTFDVLNSHARVGPALIDSDRAALWLAVLVTHFVAVATIVPLYLLLRRYRSRVESWRAVCLWPLVPALAVFLPKSDALYPFLGTLFLWLWLEGCARSSLVHALFAGAVLWLGMSLSLALLPVAALGAFLAMWEWRTASTIGSRIPGGRRLVIGTVAAAIGFLLPTFALWLAYDVNLFNVWLWNYRNHAAFYEHYTRTWWKWLLVNPAELALAAGVPLALAALVGAWRSAGFGKSRGEDGRGDTGREGRIPASQPRSSPTPASVRLVHLGPAAGCLLIWGTIWLWGKNMGEAARLWLVLQPWLVWLAAGAFAAVPEQPSRRTSSGETRWLWTMIAQAVVCVATVMRVSGFHYLREVPAETPTDRARPAASTGPNDWRDRSAGSVLSNLNRQPVVRVAAAR